VTIDPHHEVVRRDADSGVEPVGGAAGRVVDDPYARIGCGELRRDLRGAVVARADGEDDLDRSGVPRSGSA
jgi:hypothetical protein